MAQQPRKVPLMAAFFIGSPLGFVLGLALVHAMPAPAALLVGAAVGTLLGRAFLMAI